MLHLATHWRTEASYCHVERKHGARSRRHAGGWAPYVKRQARREERRNARKLVGAELFDPCPLPFPPTRSELVEQYPDVLSQSLALFQHGMLSLDELLPRLRLLCHSYEWNGDDLFFTIEEHFSLLMPEVRGTNWVGFSLPIAEYVPCRHRLYLDDHALESVQLWMTAWALHDHPTLQP